MASSLPIFRSFGSASRTFSWSFISKLKAECKYQSIRVPSLTICRKCSNGSNQVKAPGLGEHQHHRPRHENWARDLIYSLDAGQRTKLMNELADFEKAKIRRLQEIGDMEPIVVPKLTLSQKRQLAVFTGLPFVGFGTLDNIVMITAGEYIDNVFGAWLGISTMAAAALGNMVSDIVGIGTAGYVEQCASKIGILPPELTPEQVDIQSTRWISTLGRMVGVAIGCTIGMAPLFLIKRDEDEEEKSEDSEDKPSDSNPERTEK